MTLSSVPAGMPGSLNALDQGRGEFCRGAKIKILKRHERHSDGRNAQQRALDGGGNRAGINNIVAEIRPLVDPRDDQVGFYRQQAGKRELDAIDRSAVHRHAPRRRVHGRAAAGAGSVHGSWSFAPGPAPPCKFSPTWRRAVFEGGEPFGLDAVVVGEQDDHGRIVAKKAMRTSAARAVSTCVSTARAGV